MTHPKHMNRPVLAVNLDETMVLLHHGGQKGLIWMPKSKSKARRQRTPNQKLTLGAKRQCLTHVAMISNIAEVNKKLPQIILGNEHVIPAACVRELSDSFDPSIQIWRRKSSWVTGSVMKEIAQALYNALKEYQETHRIVLLLDCCSAHLDSGYITWLAHKKIGVVFVPAGLTWLLQPLDTHAFARYKMAVSDRYRRTLIDSESSVLSNSQCIRIIAETIPPALQNRDWRKAFAGNGFGGREDKAEDVRQAIWQSLECESNETIPSSLPSVAQFERIFPKKRDFPLTALMEVFKDLPRRAICKKASPVIESPKVPLTGNPWLGRLRSSSSLPSTAQPFLGKSSDDLGSKSASSSSEPWPKK